MYVFKVVKKSNNKFYSICAKSNLKLEYKLGKEIKAPIGKIFAYTNIEEAVKCLSFGNRTILLCKVNDIERYSEKPILCIHRKTFTEKELIYFWNMGRKKSSIFVSPFYGGDSPYGTVLCSMVIPIVEIKINKKYKHYFSWA